MQRPYAEVDVFTDVPCRGNPLAVVLDGTGICDAAMQRFANWTNFSETTFLLPPTDPAADYAVRIFTTTKELPFAGHPTIGSCHAWLGHGGTPKQEDRIVQECGIGLVTLGRSGAGRIAFAAPPLLRHGPLDEATLDRLVAVLGIDRSLVLDAAWIDNGPGWMGVLLESADRVLAVRPSDSELKCGLIGPHRSGHDAAYEVRGFFPANGRTFEDPVTGSLNASAAQWLIAAGRFVPPYVATQGTVLGRSGRVYVSRDGAGQIWIAGDAVTCVTGTVEL